MSSRLPARFKLVPALLVLGWVVSLATAQEPAKVTMAWDKVVSVSKATPTLQVVVNPPLRRGEEFHKKAFQALKDLECENVRYVPWYPYPRLGVAELEPPKDGKTSWDFSLIDPMTEDFMNSTKGHSVMLNFSTIPQWMFKTEKPVPYPDDPNEPIWNYSQGQEFRDPSLKELADYYERLLSWYVKGGFTDEYGVFHKSDHHYKIDYWEVLNEVAWEHDLTPELYTRMYDAIVERIQRIDPNIKFAGLALGIPNKDHFEYFLNPKNHKPGIPIDMISYHFYAIAAPDQTDEIIQHTHWEKAEHFVDVVGYVQDIRKRLNPDVQTTINEIGVMSREDANEQFTPGHRARAIPQAYWNLSAAMFAYIYAELAGRGVEYAASSQLVGYPTQFPSVTLIDHPSGQPNPRYWMLKLLKDNFGPGDKVFDAKFQPSSMGYMLYARGFETPKGKRKILLINKRDRSFEVTLPDAQGAKVEFLDQSTGFQPAVSMTLTESKFLLSGYSVAIVTLAK